MKVRPVILSGGAGQRLWPLSREHYPKQFLPLYSELSLLQETLARVTDSDFFLPPVVICNVEHRFIVAEQIRNVDVQPLAIILEPIGRNTAPAIAVAALNAAERDPDELLLILPADHTIADLAAFRSALKIAATAATLGHLVTFGIEPNRPETGYGYIRAGVPLDDVPGAWRTESFVEKPPRERAEAFLAAGNYLWNSGMFLFRADRYLEELERFRPEVVATCRHAHAGWQTDLDFVRLDAKAFAATSAISVDHAVMEATDAGAVVPIRIGWSDVGSWNELWRISPKDESGNGRRGDVVFNDSHNCFVVAGDRLVVAHGIADLVVACTDDAVLVTARERADDLKAALSQLSAARRHELVNHTRVHRPWGYYQLLHKGNRFQVKQLSIKPGARLSLQKHFHRAEHWVVVNGTAMIRRDNETTLLRENESVYVPVGSVHSIENPGRIMLTLIEVQSGAYLGEDDIVRMEDVYGRL